MSIGYCMAMAKIDYQDGFIDSFTLVRKGLKWMIEFSRSDRDFKRVFVAARGEIRLFSTVDSAIKCVEEVGFSVHALKYEVM